MADRRALATLSDEGLASALRDLGLGIAVPDPVPGADPAHDPARLARLRIESGAARPRSRRPDAWHGRWRLRRSLALALIAVAVLVAIAGAIGLGLPGVRILPGGSGGFATPSVPAQSAPAASGRASAGPVSPRPVGATLGLGAPVTLDGARAMLDFPILLPSDPAAGPPAAAWMLERRLTLAWPASASLPALREPSVGLLLAEFRGSVDPGYFEKILNPQTRIEPVTVRGVTGWWISGEPHGIVFVTPGGDPRFDSRRIAGDTLLWARDGITYRLESALGRSATIRLAESIR